MQSVAKPTAWACWQGLAFQSNGTSMSPCSQYRMAYTKELNKNLYSDKKKNTLDQMHDCRAAYPYAEKIGHCISNAAHLHFFIPEWCKDQKCSMHYSLTASKSGCNLSCYWHKASPAEPLLVTKMAFQGWALWFLRRASQLLAFSRFLPSAHSCAAVFAHTALIHPRQSCCSAWTQVH